MTKNQIAQYAVDALIDELQGKDNVSAEDLGWEIGRLDTPDYTTSIGDYADTINSLEFEYWGEAEDYVSGKKYDAPEWNQAQEDWANALELAAFSSLFYEKQEELKEELEEFHEYITGTLKAPKDVKITLTRECRFGWAPHDRETRAGIHIWKKIEGEFQAAAVEALPGLWINAIW